jgi:TolA-binding protein
MNRQILLAMVAGLCLLPAAHAQSTNDFEAARRLYQDGKWQDALAAFQNFEVAYPFSAVLPDAIRYEGWCWFNLHRYDEAANAFGRVLRDYPATTAAAEAMLKKAECHRALKQFDQATQLYRLFQAKYPQDALIAQAMLGEAATQFDAKDYDGAKSVLQTLRERFPDALDASLLLGQVLTEEKQYEEANKVYHDLLDRHPDGRIAEQVSYSLIQSLVQRGELEKAGAEIERFKKQFPHSVLLESATLAQAEALYGQQNYRAALALYEPLQSGVKDPQVAETVEFRIASCYLNLGQLDKARNGFADVAEKYPHGKLAPEALYQTASIYADKKQFPEMLAALREYVKRYPDHVQVTDALFSIGTQLEAQKKSDEAIAAYRNCIARAATTKQSHESAIMAQLRIAALLPPSAAIADCETFLATFPNEPAARTVISQITALYLKASQFDAGYAKLDQLAQADPTNAAIRIACATGTIDLALAHQDFSRASSTATRLWSDTGTEKLPAASYIAVGNVFLKTQKFELAKECFQKLLAHYPEDKSSAAVGQLGLGQALFGLEQYDDAEAMLQKVSCVDADLTLAKIDEAKGQFSEAVALYSKVLQDGRAEISNEAAFRLGNIFFHQIDPSKSKENKRTALAYYARLLFATGPMAEEAAYRVGECHVVLGDLPQACAAFQNYGKRFPSGRFTSDAKLRIQRLCPTMP